MGSYVRISDENEKKIFEMFKNGMWCDDIAKELNLSKYVIYRHLKKNKLELNNRGSGVLKKPRKIDINIEKEICDLFISGLSGAEISRKLMIANSTVYRYLVKNGFEPIKNKKKHTEFFSEEIKQKIIDFYNLPETMENAAKHFGTTRRKIRSVIKRSGYLRTNYKERIFSKEDVQSIVNKWNEGFSQHVIATEHNVSDGVIRRILKENNLKPVKRIPCGKFANGYKTGRFVNKNGYVSILMNEDDKFYKEMSNVSSYVLEHRLIMAYKLGRPLTKGETVHHINGRPDDNRPENLQLMSGAHHSGIVYRCGSCGSHNIQPVEMNSTEDIDYKKYFDFV